MPDQGGIQLLPETRRKIEIKNPGENKWIYIGIIALLLVFGTVAGLGFYRAGLEDRLAGLDADLLSLEDQRDEGAETNLLTLEKQLSLMSRLLNDHVFWSKALGKIESLTQPQVQFTSFNANFDSNTFEIQALTTNYTVLARQIASFVSDDSIKDINLSDVRVRTNGQLEFSISLIFDQDKFVKEQ